MYGLWFGYTIMPWVFCFVRCECLFGLGAEFSLARGGMGTWEEEGCEVLGIADELL